MIHFRYSIINHWYMTVMHLLEFRTLYWQGLQLVSWILDPECPQLWVEFWFLAMLATDKSWSWRRLVYGTVPSIDLAINAIDREWQDTVEFGKFSSNSTQLDHRLHHSSKKTVQRGWTDWSATPQPSEWLDVWETFANKSKPQFILELKVTIKWLYFVFPLNSIYFTVYILMQTIWEVALLLGLYFRVFWQHLPNVQNCP